MRDANILFVGDPHGQFKPIVEVVRQCTPAAVVLLGDMGLERKLQEELAPIWEDTSVYFIHGNHDCDRENWYSNLMGDGNETRNLNGRVVDIGGVRVAGLGGVFRERNWHPASSSAGPRWRTRREYLAQTPRHQRDKGVPLKQRGAIWWEDYESVCLPL